MKFENVTVVLVLALRSQIIHLAELWAEEGGSADPWRRSGPSLMVGPVGPWPHHFFEGGKN